MPSFYPLTVMRYVDGAASTAAELQPLLEPPTEALFDAPHTATSAPASTRVQALA